MGLSKELNNKYYIECSYWKIIYRSHDELSGVTEVLLGGWLDRGHSKSGAVNLGELPCRLSTGDLRKETLYPLIKSVIPQLKDSQDVLESIEEN